MVVIFFDNWLTPTKTLKNTTFDVKLHPLDAKHKKNIDGQTKKVTHIPEVKNP